VRGKGGGDRRRRLCRHRAQQEGIAKRGGKWSNEGGKVQDERGKGRVGVYEGRGEGKMENIERERKKKVGGEKGRGE